jgi:putative FmdB family regulatory protein
MLSRVVDEVPHSIADEKGLVEGSEIMPLYEYYCRACERTFEKLRPMRVAEQAAVCPAGHEGAARTLSLFATAGKAGDGAAAMAAGGGCCGGGCACGANRAN